MNASECSALDELHLMMSMPSSNHAFRRHGAQQSQQLSEMGEGQGAFPPTGCFSIEHSERNRLGRRWCWRDTGGYCCSALARSWCTPPLIRRYVEPLCCLPQSKRSQRVYWDSATAAADRINDGKGRRFMVVIYVLYLAGL